MQIKINNEKTRKSCIIKVKLNLQKSGANKLIGATNAPLGNWFLGEYSWIIFKKSLQKNLLNFKF